MTDGMERPAGADGLRALERRIAHDLEMTAHPRAAWLRPRTIGGAPVLDVLVIGAGQSGLATGFALLRERVDNILIVDRAEAGAEGPWATYARMPTLRSPKDQTGPDLGLPALTFQAWYEAQFGAEGWAALRLIPRGQWAAYLAWFRRTVGLPVRNGCAVTAIAPAACDDGTPCLRAGTANGQALHARKIVLATGQDGTGRWWMPDFMAALPAPLRAHTADAIDFAALRGKRVAVLGAGASAFDNAATALEHGASVTLFCRRAEPQTIQPYRWLTFAGFLRHMGDMDDAWRWRIMGHVLGLREGFPPDTYARVTAHPDFTMHTGRPWTGARAEGDGLVIETPSGPYAADFAICGTGIRHDLRARPELTAFADAVACWRDRYAPPPEERDPERDAWLGAFPYLGPDYALQERVPGAAPFLRDIHLFGIGSTLSFGPSGSSINAMAIAVPRLVAGVTRGLFAADIAEHWASLRAYDVRQVTLDPARTVAFGA
jgi:cation diffusion facilitator CzcD-associated flavoprotein CzcO